MNMYSKFTWASSTVLQEYHSESYMRHVMLATTATVSDETNARGFY